MSVPVQRNVSPANDPRRSTYFAWEEFDAFPKLIRDLMNYTPHAVGTGFVHRQLREGVPLLTVARQAHARWSRHAREEMRRLYGETHPVFQEAERAA